MMMMMMMMMILVMSLISILYNSLTLQTKMYYRTWWRFELYECVLVCLFLNMHIGSVELMSKQAMRRQRHHTEQKLRRPRKNIINTIH